MAVASAAPAPGSEDTLRDVVARYERRGFVGQFGARLGARIMCFTCRHESDAAHVSLLALHRLEGDSDPGEEVAVAALECPLCDARGTLALTYGAGGSPEEALVLRKLEDNRGDAGIRSGI
jgi:hypothetical protein